jgi:hypothetical protein
MRQSLIETFRALPQIKAADGGPGLRAAKSRDYFRVKPKLVGQFEFVA